MALVQAKQSAEEGEAGAPAAAVYKSQSGGTRGLVENKWFPALTVIDFLAQW